VHPEKGENAMLEKSDQTLINRSKLGSGQEPSNKQRRTFFNSALVALAVSPLLVTPRQVMGQQAVNQVDTPSDPFILLLTGIYKSVPAGKGPNLGLTTVNVSDGTYSETQIYPVWGITNEGGVADQDRTIGNFFVQFAGNKCAYQLPGGAMAMQFTSGGFTPHSDGKGGFFLEGTFELTILEATGIYSVFQGGHNHMVVNCINWPMVSSMSSASATSARISSHRRKKAKARLGSACRYQAAGSDE
jgi:hypothetical protein